MVTLTITKFKLEMKKFCPFGTGGLYQVFVRYPTPETRLAYLIYDTYVEYRVNDWYWRKILLKDISYSFLKSLLTSRGYEISDITRDKYGRVNEW